MGCDIHAYIDFERGQHFFGEIEIGRNYKLFSLMADVRTSEGELTLFSPRGLPEDVNHCISRKDRLFIIPDNEQHVGNFVNLNVAEQWVKDGISKRIDGENTITHPDHHSHSWLNSQEVGLVLCHLPEYHPIIATIYATLQALPESRLIFWFDN